MRRKAGCEEDSLKLQPFDEDSPLGVASSNWTEPLGTEAAYAIVAPVLNGGWVLAGEVGKFVPVSTSRIIDLVSNTLHMDINFSGVPNETIRMRVALPGSSKIIIAECTVPFSGKPKARRNGKTEVSLNMRINLTGDVACSSAGGFRPAFG